MPNDQTLNCNFIKLNQILYFNLKIKVKTRKKRLARSNI